MPLVATLIAVLVLLALLVLSLRKRRAIDSPNIVLWRALLPSWRFFEGPDVSYVLLARACDEGLETPFAPVIPERCSQLPTLLFAPQGNLVLACHGLVEALMYELAELGPTALEKAEQLVSYRRVQHLVCFFLQSAQRYQLKVVAEEADGTLGEALFVSPIYTRE